MKRRLRLLAGAALLPLALAACGGGSDSGEAAGQIRYALWDPNQLPAYQACEKAFERKNPEIDVKIEQTGWDDYWGNLTTGFVAGTAPDVFTNHLSKYPEFASKNQLAPLNELIERDKVDTGAYFPGLAELWADPEGSRYGLPKDWDTVAVFYNKKMAKEAGISEEEFRNLTWNPQDGGTFEKVVARLTVDKNGVRGDEPGFDKDNVKTYGLALENAGGGGHGQTQWSHFAASNGWRYTNKDVWGDEYHYDDPKFVETIQWWRGLIEKGYMPSLEAALSGVSMVDQFGAGNVAVTTDGSWQTGPYFGLKGVQVGLAPLPAGPSGKRASMFNGLADSIWAGTEKKEAAWQWVKFLGSAQCQDLVAEKAVVFPAIPSSLEVAEEKFKAKGVDVTAFTVHVDEKTTVPFPITDHASDITAALAPALDSIMSFKAEPAAELRKVNADINGLFGK